MSQDYADLYGVFGVDFDKITQALKTLPGNGVISGLAVTEDSPQDYGVIVASGKARVNGTIRTFASITQVDLTSLKPAAGSVRKILVVIDSSGTITTRAGTTVTDAQVEPSATTGRVTVTPDPAEITAGDEVLAEVWADGDAAVITNTEVSDRRIDTSISPWGEGYRLANEFPGADIGSQINNARADLASGGKVVVRPGSYTLSTTITMSQANVFLAAVPRTVTITLGNSLNIDMIDITAANCTIVGLSLDGNRINQTTAGHIIDVSSTGDGANGFQCIIKSAFLDGINIANGADDIKILECEFSDMPGSTQRAIDAGTGQNVTISKCSIKSCYAGIDILGSRHIISGNNIRDSITIAITGSPTDSLISGNNIIAITDGIGIASGLTRCSIVGNTVEITGAGGTAIVADADCIVSGNMLVASGSHSGELIMISGSAASLPSVVSGNRLIGIATSARGILVHASKSLVIGNHIRNISGGSCIRVGSAFEATATTTVMGNVFQDSSIGILFPSGAGSDNLIVGNRFVNVTTKISDSSGVAQRVYIDGYPSIVFEGGTQVGTLGRNLDFSTNDFNITEDTVNDQFDIAVNRNAANGIAGLDASSKVAAAQLQEVLGLADLTDVGALTPATGHSLLYGASAWGSGRWANIRIANDFAGADIGAQFNAADTDLGTTGGTIIILPGTYSPSTQLVANNADHILMYGVTFNNSTTITLVALNNGGCILEGATFAGNPVASTFSITSGSVTEVFVRNCIFNGAPTTGYNLNPQSPMVVEDCVFNHANKGCRTSSSATSLSFRRCTFTSLSIAIETDATNGTGRTKVEDCEFFLGTGDIGIKAVVMLHTIRGCQFVNTGGGASTAIGIQIAPNATTAYDFVVSDCTFEGFTSSGWAIDISPSAAPTVICIGSILSCIFVSVNRAIQIGANADADLNVVVVGCSSDSGTGVTINSATANVFLYANQPRDATWNTNHGQVPNFAVLVPGAAVLPASGAPTLAQIDGTNVSYKVLDFADAATSSCYWVFALPTGWRERDILFKIRWRATAAITGNVVWDVAVLGRIEGEAIDTAPTAFGNTTGDAAAGTLGQISEFSITFAAASFDLVGDDLLIVRLQRLGAHANDTMTENARFVELTVGLQ